MLDYKEKHTIPVEFCKNRTKENIERMENKTMKDNEIKELLKELKK
ncbi:unnamed protein product [marine sediment metagenome]|uniref:Uncharacterized protein n=1 Tax=marine sediment metagenome TaxID=412755 RepID=X1ARU4_9ZZZZ